MSHDALEIRKKKYFMKSILIPIMLFLISCGDREIEKKYADSLDELVKVALTIKSEANSDLVVAYSDTTNSTFNIKQAKEELKTFLQSIQSKKIVKQKLVAFADYNPNDDEMPGFEEFNKVPNFNIQPSHILKLYFESPESTSLSLIFGLFSKNGKWQFAINQPRTNDK